jgi:hypothetical protein
MYYYYNYYKSRRSVVKGPDVDLVFCVEAGGEGVPEAEVAAPVEETGKHFLLFYILQNHTYPCLQVYLRIFQNFSTCCLRTWVPLPEQGKLEE